MLYDGMTVLTRQQIIYQQRRQALDDFPLLKQIHPLLRTPSGKRMARWERLAFAAELLLLGCSANKTAKAASITKLTCFQLRDRLKEGNILPSDWKASRHVTSMTIRQKECQQLMSSGLGCRKIARQLGITHTSAKDLMKRVRVQQ